MIIAYHACVAAIILIPLAILYNNFWPAYFPAYGTQTGHRNNSSSVLLNDITGKVSLADEVNANNLPSLKTTPPPPISEGKVTNSKEQEQYLTRNYTKYVIAKEQAEKVRPEDNSAKTTKVIEIQHVESLHNTTNNNPINHSIKEFRPSTIVGGGFNGLSQLCCIPPDIQLAVNSKYVMETVNSEAAIYNKTSGKLLKEFGLESLFNLPPRDSPASHAITDPVLLFDYKDHGSNSSSLRWFISISDITTHSIHLAVSKTDNPSGVWRIYDFPFRSEYDSCSDQPFVGISDDKVVISVNTWTNNCNWSGNGNENISPTFRGVQFAIADKDDLVAGAAHIRSMQSLPDASYFSLRPALDLSATTALFLVTTDDFNRNRIRILAIDGPISSLQVEYPISVAIHNTDISPDGIQPITFSSDKNDNNNSQNNYGNNNKSTGTRAKQQSTEESISLLLLQLNRVKERHPEYFVHTGDARAQSPFWYKGRLWLALNVGCNISGDQIKRSCIRIIEFDTNSTKIMLDFNLGSRGTSLYYPALSVGKSGNNIGIIIGYSSSVSGFNSSHGTYPSLLVASTSDDKNVANSIKYFEFLKKGSANALSTRYGDYFSAALDPTESQSIWVAGQYHHHHYPSGTAWSTYIGKIVQTKRGK